MSDSSSEIIAELETIKGSPVWAAVAGPGTGSMVNLHIGQKIRLEKPVNNPNISQVAREFEGEWEVFIENAGWRLDNATGVLCSSKSDNSSSGEMVEGLNQVLGACIDNIEMNFPGADLKLTFSNGMRLSIFSDCMDDSDGDNFTLFSQTEIYTVKPKGRVIKDER